MTLKHQKDGRSFKGMISGFDDLKTQVSNYAARCAEKLRQQGDCL